MSRDASVTLQWADGEYKFRLAFGQLRELQEKCNAGPEHILNRLRTGQWLVDDIRETIRIGLIGGGLEPLRALKLVTLYVEQRPLIESKNEALAVLFAALVGAPDEPLEKKEEAAEMTGQSSSEESSASPHSTGQVLQ